MIKVLIPAAVLCLAVTIFVTAAARPYSESMKQHPWGAVSADEAVAHVNDQTVVVEDVVAHMRPSEPWIGVAPPTDPRQLALDEAVRVELFIQEAERSGIKPPPGPQVVAEAGQVQGLINRQLGVDKGVELDEISEAEARRYWEEHREISTSPGTVDLSAVAVGSIEEARQLLERAKDMNDREFAGMAQEHSLHESSRSADGRLTVLRADDPEDEVEDAVSGVGYSMIEAGQVGLAKASDGRYYVLRASSVDRKQRPWDEKAVLLASNFIVEERKERILMNFEKSLRDDAEVTVDETDLLKLRAPTWQEYF